MWTLSKIQVFAVNKTRCVCVCPYKGHVTLTFELDLVTKERLLTRNTHVKYESCITYHSKIMATHC